MIVLEEQQRENEQCLSCLAHPVKVTKIRVFSGENRNSGIGFDLCVKCLDELAAEILK